jgi:putative DNA primase/helicase
MSNPENYIDAPTNNAAAVIAVAPKRAASKLGAFSGKTTDTSINALLLGPRYNGSAKEHCESPARIESGVRNGQRRPRVDQNAKPLSSPALTDHPDDAPPRNATAEPRSIVQYVAPLTSDPEPDQRMASAFPEQQEVVAAADADAAIPEGNNERLYGRYAARILSNGRRDVALAPSDAKKIAFQKVAKSIGQAVADQWLPKAAMMDWLMDIARAHGSFGLNSDQLQHLISEAAVEVHVPETPPGSVPLKRRLISHRPSDIQPERLEWVWPGRIARGKAALLGGPPGLGKSQVMANIAAIVSTGGRWPCNEGNAPQGDVVILSAEDGIADTIVPRLIAAGADTSCVRIVAAATKMDGTGRKTFSLKTDVDLLEELSREIGTVRLIIIDPISAYMGGADGNGNVETREVLEPLAEMANRLGIAVVAVTHLNKGGAGGQSALNRFAGSIAFVAAARSAYLVIEDPDDENRRLFLQAKNNLGPKGKGLAFRVEQRLIPGDILASNISWDTDHVTASVDEALIASETRGGGGENRSGKDEATDFLRSVLSNGPVAVADIEAEARAAGLLGRESPIGQNKTFRQARKELGVMSSRDGFGPGARYVLSLPEGPWMPKNSMDAPLEKRAPMTNLGIHKGSETAS